MSDVVEQLEDEAERLRLQRADVAGRLFAVDEQLERVDGAVGALRGRLPRDRVPRGNHKLSERTGSQVLAVSPSGHIEYAPAAENVERVLAVLRKHGELSQKKVAVETGLHVGTVMRVKKVLERDGVIDVYVPKKRPPDQGAGRISPVLRLK